MVDDKNLFADVLGGANIYLTKHTSKPIPLTEGQGVPENVGVNGKQKPMPK